MSNNKLIIKITINYVLCIVSVVGCVVADLPPVAVLVMLYSPASATESVTATREILVGCVKLTPGFVRKVSCSFALLLASVDHCTAMMHCVSLSTCLSSRLSCCVRWSCAVTIMNPRSSSGLSWKISVYLDMYAARLFSNTWTQRVD